MKSIVETSLIPNCPDWGRKWHVTFVDPAKENAVTSKRVMDKQELEAAEKQTELVKFIRAVTFDFLGQELIEKIDEVLDMERQIGFNDGVKEATQSE